MINQRRRTKKPSLMAEINITPFTDVALVLLIIFMVATPMLMQSGIKISLPKARNVETETDKTLVVSINARGQLFLDKVEITENVLKSKISLRVMNNPETSVVIKGDKSVKYNEVIKVIDVAREAGVKKFSLSVEVVR